MSKAPHRSYLFVPGNRPERFEKALASGADAVILDLEDAVPPDLKVEARQTVAAWLGARLPTAAPVLVRINAVDTPWFADDVAMCRQPGIEAIVVAKAERLSDLAQRARPVRALRRW